MRNPNRDEDQRRTSVYLRPFIDIEGGPGYTFVNVDDPDEPPTDGPSGWIYMQWQLFKGRLT